MMAVTPVPRPKPFIAPVALFFPVVNFSSTFWRLPPARFLSEAPIRFIPYRKRPTPPSSVKIEKISKCKILLKKCKKLVK